MQAMTLADEFHKAMIQDVYEAALKECGYHATVFKGMLARKGGLETAIELLNPASVQYGFTELWKRGRLDLTMEHLVIQERWSGLFTPDQISIARDRLSEHSSPPKGTDPYSTHNCGAKSCPLRRSLTRPLRTGT
jgi:hypothetical protein